MLKGFEDTVRFYEVRWRDQKCTLALALAYGTMI